MKTYILVAVLLLCGLAQAQTHQFCAADSNCQTTGHNGHSGPEDFTGPVTMTQLDTRIFFASTQAGADICVKIKNALTQAGNANATIEARGFTGTQTCSTNPYANLTGNANVQILLDSSITTSAPWFVNASGVLTKCASTYKTCQLTANASTFPINSTLVKMGATADATVLMFGTRFEDMTLNCNNVTGCSIFEGNGLNEMSGLKHVNLWNSINTTAKPQAQVNVGPAITGHFLLEDLQFADSGANDGLLITGSAQALMAQLKTITCNNTGSTTGAACIHVVSSTPLISFHATDIHAEGYTDTVFADTNSLAYVDHIDCSGVCTNALHINTTKAVMGSAIWGYNTSATNVVQNDITSCGTITRAAEANVTVYAQSSSQGNQQIFAVGGSTTSTPTFCGSNSPRLRIKSSAAGGSGNATAQIELVDGSENGWQLRSNGLATPALEIRAMTAGVPTATPAAIVGTTHSTFNNGVANGTGFQHTRQAASCTTAASVGAVCNAVVTWPVAFADTNYTPICTILASSGVPTVLNLNTRSATTATFVIQATTAVAATGTMNCHAFHD